MTDTKLDPATLSATVREVARGIKVGFDRNGEISQTHLLDWIMAMTALFAPATEKVETTADRIAADLKAGTFRGAQPEPAAPVDGVWRCESCGDMASVEDPSFRWAGDRWQHSHPNVQAALDCRYFGPKPEPAAPEMPEAVSNALGRLSYHASCPHEPADMMEETLRFRDALESWWRTHSQPVAHPFKAGFKPDSMRHFAEYVRDNWHYFGTDTAGLAHQFLQEMAAQPVAVGMTEELSMVLLRAEYGATEDERNPNLRDGYVARLKSAIETVRQQAAQVKL